MTAQTTPSRGTSQHFEQLCLDIPAAMDRLQVPGAAIAVLHGGNEESAGFGVTSVEHPLPVTADTLFQVGSISKTVTGTTIMQLIHEGTIVLEAPVRRYLPEMRLADEEVAGYVTVRHLLTHTGGWVGDYFDDLGLGEDALARIVDRLADLPQLTPPGETWAYSNSSFYLAGRIIEVVEGKQYEQVIQERIFDPLGMSMSFFFPGDVMTRRFAVGHQSEGDRIEVARPWPVARAANPVGGVTSTVLNLLKYARFHLGDGTAPGGTRLMSPDLLKLMRTPQAPADDGREVGLTWFIRKAGDKSVVEHGGATHGQMALLSMVPESGFVIAMLTNGNYGTTLIRETAKAARRIYLGIEERDTQTAEPPAQLEEYAGRYTGHLSDVELRHEGDALAIYVIPRGGFPAKDSPPWPAPPPSPLAFCGNDNVIATEGVLKDTKGEFLRGPDGEIVWFRYGGRILRKER
ncbi:MAG TPA: serine hydrolase domain-containing protein [Chloroflexia bacterium]|nr:serine hydrolase domain-containing protein [Chloroflexia bacterium]